MTLPLYGLNFAAVNIFYYIPSLPDDLLLTIMVFGPTVGYFDLLMKMLKTRKIDGFSLHSALIMLLSNTLRFFYWTFEPFQNYLLGQSIAVFVIQFVLSILSYILTNSTSEKSISNLLKREFSYNNFRHYDFQKVSFYLNTIQSRNAIDFLISLLLYLGIIFITFSLFYLIFGLNFALTVFIYSSNIIDTFVSLPTFLSVVIKKEYNTVSTVLLLQQIIGDVLKLAMYSIGKSGFAFVFGAMLQTSLDAMSTMTYFTNIRKSGGFNFHFKNSENLDF